MRALRFAASIAIVAGILTLYRTALAVNNTTVALSLLLGVLGISAWWGLAEASVASVAAALGFNILFLPPIGHLTIQDPQNWISLGAFLVTAATASQLSDRARRRTAEADARRSEIERLYSLMQSMMLSGNARKTISEFVHTVVRVFGCEGAALYYSATGEIFRSGPASNVVSNTLLVAAAEIAGVSMDAGNGVAMAPLLLGLRPLGSIALIGRLPSEQMMSAIVNLISLTIERARAIDDASHAEAARQGEVLKSALLDSLAHDIKTPLTSIKAAVTSLLGSTGQTDRELLTIINEETDRLNQLAAEVVEMARIEAGKLHLEKQPVAVAELISNALAGLSPAIHGRTIKVRMEPGLPDAEADHDFAMQVVKHFVENALKYTPEASPVDISAEMRGGKIVIGVMDHGTGLEENERARIFEKFYRGRRHRFDTKGTGMGLAIAKGIVEAHGERIWVESEPGQGSAFYFSLAPVAGGSRA
jgi:two-component system, OmpR family, sensor histidine kinase KdpD